MNQHNKITGISFIGLLQIGCLGVLLGSLAPLLAPWFWPVDLLASFRVQYLLLSLVFAVVFVLKKQRVYASMALVAVLVNAVWVLPLYSHAINGSAHAAGPAPANRLKLFYANVYSGNHQHDPLIQQVQNENADVVLLQEVNARWLTALDVIKASYPHRIEIPREDNFGIAVFSRLPFESQQIHDWTLLDIPSIEFEIEQGGQMLRLITTHPPPPVNRIYYDAAQQQFQAIAERLNNKQQASILIGDLNTTMWSKHYPILTTDTGLVNASQGFMPTWPTNLLPLLIPIDHCLVSRHFEVLDIRTGAGFGSDHWPLVVDLGF
ncbi:endonuclease/exonuclease/phosphatase family protein [Marinicella meishanensis]|uniref:endonuclease/exonuclease/phosphatase family protein n=1 Tax=Marinicella meishanensis TaxID=2873263 RepID=UPI001CBB0840|nr:endonuclease/exonuclease/phosphatase family protein [Marinicella sp. NBU2979]